MSVTVHLYATEKKPNSTSRTIIDDTEGDKYPYAFYALLKDPCSITNPVLQFSFATADIAQKNVSRNFCRIPAFNRYYNIVDWVSEGSLWNAYCEVDVLASYRDAIGESTQYVLRSASRGDGTILDTFYPATSECDFVTGYGDEESRTLWGANFNGDGVYIIGMVNDDDNSVGATAYYVLTPSKFADLRHILLSSDEWLMADIDDVSSGVMKSLFNPMQYITTCMWFPISIADLDARDMLADQQPFLKFGWWTTELRADVLKAFDYVTSTSIEIPKHPQAQTRGVYMNLAPYSRYTLCVEPLGIIPLDSTLLTDSARFYLDFKADLITGRMLVSPSVNYADMWECQLGVPINVAQVTSDYLRTASSAISTVVSTAGSFATGDVAGGIASATSGIVSTIESALPQVACSGGNGSAVAFMSGVPRIKAQFFRVVDNDVERHGKPLCKSVQIKTLNGYIVCQNSALNIPKATSSEKTAIKSFMDGGFYYE